MKHYRFLEHTADIAFEVRGHSHEELFLNSAMAWQETVFEEFIPHIIGIRDISLFELTIEELLVGFLSELNYLLFVNRWITDRISGITIRQEDEMYHLEARLEGENYSPEIHRLKEEIKAVTFHNMKVEKIAGMFITRIVFDI